MSVATFNAIQPHLKKLLDDIATGKMQLPDFQRGWVWDDEHIKSLIASLSLSFPIGAVMTLETGGSDVRFKPRPIEGTDSAHIQEEPETLILDGQQRLTSLFQSLMAGNAVETKDAKGKKIKRWYYLDMRQCIADVTDREEAVVSVPEDRFVKNFHGTVTLNLSSLEKEYENERFPVHQLFNSADWRQGYQEHWKYDQDKIKLFNAFETGVIKFFEQYQVPVIELSKETPKEAVCLVFEKVNTRGVTLTAFELLTASFAADNFGLREDWDAREKDLKGKYQVLHGLQSTDFLQALTLLATRARPNTAISCRRRDILRLSVDEYKAQAGQVQKGFVEAARFLHGQKIFSAKDLPYPAQLIPLAAILADLGDKGDSEGARQKIARWYWCGVLGEVYSGQSETRFARDLPQVTGLVRGETAEPSTIRDANFQAGRLLTLRTRNSAAYKGVYALLMRDGCRDFFKGSSIDSQKFFDDRIDIHHVFPQAWCKKQEIRDTIYNSIINKAPLDAKTNKMIGSQAPSTYLNKLEQKAEIDRTQMNEILASHGIPADALRADNFPEFFAGRAEELIQRIESAMGKKVAREDGQFSGDMVVEDYDDGPIDWEEEKTTDESVV